MIRDMSKFADIHIDRAIIKRAARGDARAHEILYRAFATPVYSLCLRFTRVAELVDAADSKSAGGNIGSLELWYREGDLNPQGVATGGF